MSKFEFYSAHHSFFCVFRPGQPGAASTERVAGAEHTRSQSILEAYFYDWQVDPFSMGAHSYGKAGCDGAAQALTDPLEDTLFFAGEATDITGHNGTVRGAIASGYRAARQISQAP